ncbi:hypothetical protein HYH03_019094 [Edaphochlamys debaryana]|uniref:D-alanyl-D-alanine carboxypeptidase-like core domain-containing protein n=1 Tax=Edaphochlamys debaryana TaxID=47281 RepID=A0A835XER5_9CHLO|nr:hypothetical protein HYH03_019094 [Edaphochlamys debaryana]|eukprot:KAG2481950.1 hypothetical protein HYH03_019094 [Edaphochlamys debaryana]
MLWLLLVGPTVLGPQCWAYGHNCTLGSILDKGSQCGTYAVIGLTRQIAAEIALLNVTLVALTPEQAKHVNCLSAEGCTGLLNPVALDALVEAAKARGKPITLVSMWRSAAQQYLLYQHKALGICGQTNPVSRPGNSNHEGGTGIDVDGTGRQAWKKPLKDVGWKHLSGDPPHFYYLNKKDPNTKYSLMAFQRLWNRHNPTAKIAEDGKYNSETAEALHQAPCQGW